MKYSIFIDFQLSQIGNQYQTLQSIYRFVHLKMSFHCKSITITKDKNLDNLLVLNILSTEVALNNINNLIQELKKNFNLPKCEYLLNKSIQESNIICDTIHFLSQKYMNEDDESKIILGCITDIYIIFRYANLKSILFSIIKTEISFYNLDKANNKLKEYEVLFKKNYCKIKNHLNIASDTLTTYTPLISDNLIISTQDVDKILNSIFVNKHYKSFIAYSICKLLV